MSRTRVERNISYDDEKKKYYVNLDFGRDARGRQIKKTRTFARLTDARKALRLHEAQRDFGALTQPNDTTVAQWLNYWMDAVVRPNRAATTVHGYSQMIVNHSGATIYNISKSLGHSTVATTSMIYTHLLDTTHEQTIEAVAQSLRKGIRDRKREKAE